MSRRAVTREFYDALVAAFRASPGHFTAASRQACCEPRTAKRGWELGWVPRLQWARPIRDVLEDEKLAARAEQRRVEEEDRKAAQVERDKVRQDAVKALAQEGQMLAAARANVLAELASATQALPAMRKLIEHARDAMLDPTYKPTPAQSIKLFREFNLGIRYMVDATDRLIEAERRAKGEPTAVLGIVGADGEMSFEDAKQTIEHVTGLYELARERGLFGPGEAAPPPPAKPPGNGSVH